ncbi:MAG: hypothetical protein EOO75_12380, partial [Myxococcales bacterium]
MPRSAPRATATRPAATTPRATIIKAEIAEAADVGTPPARLTELAASMSPRVLRALAANPSTPKYLLERLVISFPVEVTSNASWPLLAMVDPTFGEQVQNAEATTSVDGRVLEELARQPALRRRVASNPAASPALLAALAASGDPEVSEAVAWHPACPVETLVTLAAGGDPAVGPAVASHPRCPVETLRRLAGLDLPRINHALSLNESAPVDVLDRLADSPQAEVRMAVAIHRASPPGALVRLVAFARENDDTWLELTLVEHRALPPEVLDRMTLADNVSLHRRAACHPSAPAGTPRVGAATRCRRASS